MFSFICARMNGCVNNCEAGDLRPQSPPLCRHNKCIHHLVWCRYACSRFSFSSCDFLLVFWMRKQTPRVTRVVMSEVAKETPIALPIMSEKNEQVEVISSLVQVIWKSIYKKIRIEIHIALWVWSQRCGCLVSCFCYQLIAKLSNNTVAPSWPYPYIVLHIFKSLLIGQLRKGWYHTNSTYCNR